MLRKMILTVVVVAVMSSATFAASLPDGVFATVKAKSIEDVYEGVASFSSVIAPGQVPPMMVIEQKFSAPDGSPLVALDRGVMFVVLAPDAMMQPPKFVFVASLASSFDEIKAAYGDAISEDEPGVFSLSPERGEDISFVIAGEQAVFFASKEIEAKQLNFVASLLNEGKLSATQDIPSDYPVRATIDVAQIMKKNEMMLMGTIAIAKMGVAADIGKKIPELADKISPKFLNDSIGVISLLIDDSISMLKQVDVIDIDIRADETGISVRKLVLPVEGSTFSSFVSNVSGGYDAKADLSLLRKEAALYSVVNLSEKNDAIVVNAFVPYLEALTKSSNDNTKGIVSDMTSLLKTPGACSVVVGISEVDGKQSTTTINRMKDSSLYSKFNKLVANLLDEWVFGEVILNMNPAPISLSVKDISAEGVLIEEVGVVVGDSMFGSLIPEAAKPKLLASLEQFTQVVAFGDGVAVVAQGPSRTSEALRLVKAIKNGETGDMANSLSSLLNENASAELGSVFVDYIGFMTMIQKQQASSNPDGAQWMLAPMIQAGDMILSQRSNGAKYLSVYYGTQDGVFSAEAKLSADVVLEYVMYFTILQQQQQQIQQQVQQEMERQMQEEVEAMNSKDENEQEATSSRRKHGSRQDEPMRKKIQRQ